MRIYKKPKANIVLIVLFLLIASSLFGVMMSQQARSLLQATQQINHYYHAYYTAFAGIQQGLVQQSLHGYGYEDTFTLTLNPRSTGQISLRSRTTSLGMQSSGCTQGYALAGGDALILPLFFDTAKGFEPLVYQTIPSFVLANDYKPDLTVIGTPDVGTLIIKIVDEKLINYNTQESITLLSTTQEIPLKNMLVYDSTDASNKNYLLVANPNPSSVNICLSSLIPLVDTKVSITSLGTYRDSSVRLYAEKNYQLPGFLAFGTVQ